MDAIDEGAKAESAFDQTGTFRPDHVRPCSGPGLLSDVFLRTDAQGAAFMALFGPGEAYHAGQSRR